MTTRSKVGGLRTHAACHKGSRRDGIGSLCLGGKGTSHSGEAAAGGPWEGPGGCVVSFDRVIGCCIFHRSRASFLERCSFLGEGPLPIFTLVAEPSAPKSGIQGYIALQLRCVDLLVNGLPDVSRSCNARITGHDVQRLILQTATCLDRLAFYIEHCGTLLGVVILTLNRGQILTLYKSSNCTLWLTAGWTLVDCVLS